MSLGVLWLLANLFQMSEYSKKRDERINAIKRQISKTKSKKKISILEKEIETIMNEEKVFDAGAKAISKIP